MSSKQIITLDSSQIKQYLTCPESFNLMYNQDLRKSYFWSQDYADRGTLFHSLCDLFYTFRALNPNEDRIAQLNVVVKLFKENRLFDQFDLPKDQELTIIQRFTQYVMRYFGSDFNVLMKNNVPAVEVGFSEILYEDEEVIYILEGRIDLLVKVEGLGNVFVDHKTRERNDGDLYGWKPQFLCYALATKFNYGMYNYIGTAKGYDEKETFKRQLVHIPQWKIEEWHRFIIANVYNKIYAIKRFDITSWLKNFNSCSGAWEKKPCQFTQICETHKTEQKELIKATYFEKVKKWSPWT